jgi:hypothetical protein
VNPIGPTIIGKSAKRFVLSVLGISAASWGLTPDEAWIAVANRVLGNALRNREAASSK